jgi:hypothetical protein
MAEAPQNVSVLQGQAFGGGLPGGIAGALTGALMGGVPEAATAYQNVTGAIQKEQTHQADLMARYADLELKSRDLQQRDMEIQVLQAEQDGKVADARLATERAKNAFSKLPQFINMDNDKITLDSIMAQRQVNQQGRQVVAQHADVVDDEQSHAQAYQQIKTIADEAGIPMEQFAPGLTEEWRGKETIDAYIANKWVATASQQTLETERAENLKYKRITERDAIQHEQIKDRASQKLIHDLILQQRDAELRLQLKRLEDLGTNIKRSDLSDSTVKELNVSLATQMLSLSNYYSSKSKRQELAGIMEKAANEIEKEVDLGYIAYKDGKLPRPLTQAEATERKFKELWSMTDLDGKVHRSVTAKFKREREDWVNAWVKGASVDQSIDPATGKPVSEVFLEKYPTRQQQLQKGLSMWNNPTVDREGTGVQKIKAPTVTAQGF